MYIWCANILSFGVIGRLAGLLLAAAAVAKLQGLGVSPVGRAGLFSLPEFQIALIEFEIVLAIWLFAGKQPIAAWFVTIGTFTVFAAVSAYQGWIGQTSCGCFGAIRVHPWQAFALDAGIVTLLLLGRPLLKPLWDDPRRRIVAAARWAALSLSGMVLAGGLVIGAAHMAFGSVGGAIAHFRGERLSVSPRLADVGYGIRGESRAVTVTLTNWTEAPIQVFGGTADCSCTVLGDLPVTIGPKQSQDLAVEMRLTGAPGAFTRKAAFLINDGGYKRVNFHLTGRIGKSPEMRKKREKQ